MMLSLATRPVVADSLNIVFRHDEAHDSPTGKVSEYFKRLLEQRTENRIQVLVQSGFQHPDWSPLKEDLANGIAQMGVEYSSNLMDLSQQLQLFNLPFLFQDENHRRRVIDGEVGQKLLHSASRNGLKALAFWDGGFRQLTTNRELSSPYELRGLNIGSRSSASENKLFTALGVHTIAIAPTQRFGALSDGRIDGQESSFAIIIDQKLYEVQTNLVISDHSYEEHLVLVNSTFWQQVPEDLRVIIRGAIDDAAIYAREMAVGNNRKALEEIRRLDLINIQVLTRAERNLWRNSMKNQYEAFSNIIGEKLFHEVLTTE
jgi:C4-dicarboxylate-binding protein DctP